ncbi:MAG: hypothetical protein SPI59_03130 [Finegoldia sp.]|nr:hypothetical protein [Finegoldia sp.]
MSDKTFPSDEKEYLTCLFLKSQDLTKETPESLVKLYEDTYDQIDSAFKKLDPKDSQKVHF